MKLLILLAIFLSNISNAQICYPSNKKITTVYGEYDKFNQSINNCQIYKNKFLLEAVDATTAQIVVDIKKQRIKLLIFGQVAFDSPATTGSRYKKDKLTGKLQDKRTPLGIYNIKEKIENKRSNIFGKLYKNKKIIYKGDRRKYDGNMTNLNYVGTSLSNWMRLTWDGIGIHASKYIWRKAKSNGCIRVPLNIAKKLFQLVKVGTEVSVI